MARKRLDVESALASLAMFRACSHAELEPIVRDTRVVRARRGEMLFAKGDPCAGFHVIMYGQVKLSLSTAQGGEKVLQIYGPGQTFGEAVMFLERPYPVHAQALSEALEYPNLSEFLRSLVDKALADRKTRIQERIDQIEEDHENKLRKLAQLQATLDEDEPPLAPTADGTF